MRPRPDIAVRTSAGDARSFAWWSEQSPPLAAVPADDTTRADDALRRARTGTALAYEGDWHNARQLLAAMGRRLRPIRPRGGSVCDAFLAARETRRVEQLGLSRLAVPIGPGWVSPLARAPSLEEPLREAFGAAPDRPALLPLREVLGAIGAYEWYRRGVPVPGLGAVHPRYGVFAPVRGEYVALVARVLEERSGPLALAGARAFDVGTGSGVLAFLLARAGAAVTATDLDPRAVASARDDAGRLGLSSRIEVLEADLFPPGRARLVVANPPWIPGEPHGPVDRAIYDPGGQVLERVVAGLAEHLDDRGEGWLVLSDLAERLGVRDAGSVEARIASAGLRVGAVHRAAATHARARGRGPRASTHDLVAAARAAEVTRLYVLKPASSARS